MISAGTTYCNVCGAEIPSDEPNNAFTSTLLAKPGHVHSECLGQRNAILTQYEQTVYALGCLLDPTVDSAPKALQAASLEAKRGKPLGRMAKAAHVSALIKEPKALKVKKTVRKKATKKRGKRGA